MATSKITLYKTNLTPTKYWKLDDIEAYLSTCQSTLVSGTKYVKPDLNTSIKIPRGQEYLASLGLGLNYARVTTTEDSIIVKEHTEYYFITSYDWNGKKSITLNLQLDTLNSISGTEMTDITQIIREHQDRWTKLNNTYYAIVDKYSEGISVVKDTLLSSSAVQASSMYAVQISRNATTPDLTDKTPYGTYFCFDSSRTWESGQSSATQYTLGAATYYNINKSILITEGQTTFTNQTGTNNIGVDTETFNDVRGTLRASIIEMYTRSYDGSKYSFTCQIHNLYYTGDTYPYNYLGRKEGTKYTWTISSQAAGDTIATFWNMLNYYTLDGTNYNNYQNNSLDALMAQATKVTIKAGTYAARKTVAFKNLDRTNSSILAIYKVPYMNITTTNGTFVEGFNLIKLNDYDTDVTFANTPSVSKLYRLTIPSTIYNSNWDKKYETKLYSNEITDIGIYYQSDCLFNWDAARFESNGIPYITCSMRVNEDNPQLLRFHFNSDQYYFKSTYDHYAFEPAKYTVPLYTNEWNDYVRNGYNYDVAERERQKTLQGWNIALNTASAVASFIPGVGQLASAGISGVGSAIKTAHNLKMAKKVAGDISIDELAESTPEEKADVQEVLDASVLHSGYVAFKNNYQSNGGTKGLGQMVLNQGIGAVNSAVSSALSIQSANANYQQNINTKAVSHTAITGNNSDYRSALDNTVELQYWQPQDYVLNNIAKTFHLTGYSHPVQEVPNTKSRYWFNYLQCIPSWSEATMNNYRPDFLNDLAAKYQSGVTIFHYQGGYNLNQDKENIETALI